MISPTQNIQDDIFISFTTLNAFPLSENTTESGQKYSRESAIRVLSDITLKIKGLSESIQKDSAKAAEEVLKILDEFMPQIEGFKRKINTIDKSKDPAFIKVATEFIDAVVKLYHVVDDQAVTNQSFHLNSSMLADDWDHPADDDWDEHLKEGDDSV